MFESRKDKAAFKAVWAGLSRGERQTIKRGAKALGGAVAARARVLPRLPVEASSLARVGGRIAPAPIEFEVLEDLVGAAETVDAVAPRDGFSGALCFSGGLVKAANRVDRDYRVAVKEARRLDPLWVGVYEVDEDAATDETAFARWYRLEVHNRRVINLVPNNADFALDDSYLVERYGADKAAARRRVAREATPRLMARYGWRLAEAARS